MENNPSFQDSLAVEHPESSSSRSYLPVYIAVFFLIVVLIVVTGVLMNRPSFLNNSSRVVLTPTTDMSSVCNSYSTTYPARDGFGAYSVGLVTVGKDTYCELTIVGTLVTVDKDKFELSNPGKLQNILVHYDDTLQISPADSIQTFAPDFYDLGVYERLQKFKDVVVGVTIKVMDDETFFATDMSVGGRILNTSEIKAKESTQTLNE